MKKAIFLLLFLITSQLLAQKFEIDVSVKMSTWYNDRRCNSYAKITVQYEDSSLGIEEIYYNNSKSIDETKYSIGLKGRVKKISATIYAKDARDEGWSTCCNCSSTRSINVTEDKFVYNDYERASIPTIEKGNDGQVWGKLEVSYEIRPIVNLTQPVDDLIGFDDYVNVSVDSDSYDFKAPIYNWEYQVVATGVPNKNNWLDMPSSANTQGKPSFSIKPSSFLSISDIGKKIYFRVNIYKKRCLVSIFPFRFEDCPITSDEIFYKLTKSAPHIASVNTTNITCYEEEDGSIKINFDRELEPNESLSIAIEDLDKFEGYVNGVPTYETVRSSSNVALMSDNSYTFNKDIGKGLRKGKFRVVLLGGGITAYNGDFWNTYTGAPTHKFNFTIREPNPVEFSVTPTNVWCHGGSDGTITIKAKGGQDRAKYKYLLRETGDTSPVVESDWVEFTNSATFTGTFPNVTFEATEVITGKLAGNYTLQIKDANNCIAKRIVRDGAGYIIGLAEEIIETIEIKQPEKPVSIDFVYEKQPTAFGFSDGEIKAHVTGGTPLPKGKYNFTWKHENGTIWNTFSDIVNTDGWYLTLENAIAGKYSLTITDANYNNAINKEGCAIVNAEYILQQPPKLKLKIEETNSISCNSNNIYGDPSSDGELTAIASGGVPFSPLIQGKYKYKYTWKKKDASGVYQIIPGETGNVLKNRGAGEYAVNIEDANGIIIGTYTNNTLVNPTDIEYELKQPELLKITYTKQDVFCHQGTDGAINATITGGTGNYTISWNTGETTEDISELVAGNYTIEVTDEKGCQAQETITIEEPQNPININYNFFEPTFAGATNGWIKATVTGGTPLNDGSYTYTWQDANGNNLNTQVTSSSNIGSYELTLNNIGEGTYKLTIQDKNYPLAVDKKGCTVIESEYYIDDPEPLKASVELRKPISCNSSNSYGDPFSDGVLEVIAEGGIKLQPNENNGLPYYYTWKKETNPGVWTILTTQTSNIASGLDAGNYAVNIEDANGIILGVYKNNVLETPTDVIYNFEEPPLLELTFEKQDVYCYEGSDGWAKAIIKGGVLPYTIKWENGNSTAQINNLTKGEYSVTVTDARGCQVTGSILINQPENPISIDFTAFATPSTGGVSDGWIQAEIEGGTSFADDSYTYYWQDEKGTILNGQTETSIVNGKFQIKINNIPKGLYHLTIEDANYIAATTKEGCTYIEKEFILYDPIEATISIEKPISCNQNNKFNNPYADGALKASITGGLPFSTGQSYIYYWKKKNSSGVYEDLNQNNPIATDLSTGEYALNVEDSRGVIIGVYESLQLINPSDVLFSFEEPELLALSLSATEISCDTGNDGTATVAISGGIPPYNIQWSNGATTATAEHLIAGNHLVFVTDARGCEVTGSITIGQPGGLKIEVNKKNPTCYGANDGAISLDISGGEAPYTYKWETGEKATSLLNLVEGTYKFSLIDANGCKAFTEVKLENPEKLIIDLGSDKTLCIDQTYFLDASIDDENATYNWISSSGFSSKEASITITEGGIYTVTATSSLGCVATDTITINYSNQEINAEFLLSSQAYINEEVVVFHTSNPAPESFEWVLPKEAELVEEKENTVVLSFSKAGTYEVGLLTKVGDCVQEVYKKVVVEEESGLVDPGDTETPFIEAFSISPNPNKGNFEVSIDLVEATPISLRIFNTQGQFITKHIPNETLEEYSIPFTMNLASGMYVVVIETAKQTQVKRMIVD
ncbi:T9SS type A sorting domain-containing protein [Tenacibaculum mesophilum]|uniref:T9SS type A sorting domain-containing protein n=1 Tax=Tenacibaculum mesophilum TaxID=104268 RepID=A0AAE9MQ80_9FLAO|nr:T9SS type A sorting domain-containing protein [Tenacibaculum mesophilum]UTD16532.1 T9SS type A sorting domain-containing protein [Tenacibaculum mesophilum]